MPRRDVKPLLTDATPVASQASGLIAEHERLGSDMPSGEIFNKLQHHKTMRVLATGTPTSPDCVPNSPTYFSSSSESSLSSGSASSSASSSSAPSSPSPRLNQRNSKKRQARPSSAQSVTHSVPKKSSSSLSRRDEARVAKLSRALSASYRIVNCIHSRADFERNHQHHAVLFQAVRHDSRTHGNSGKNGGASRRVCAVWVAPRRRKQAVHRLRREATILHALKHRNIVRFYGAADEAGGTVVTIALEYCARGSSADAARRTTAGLPELEAVKLIRGALCALRFAHASGVAHGDVRPSAILIAADNSVRLSSFHRAVVAPFPPLTAEFGSDHHRSQNAIAADQTELEREEALQHLEEEKPSRFCVNRYPGHIEYAPPEALSRPWHDARAADVWATGISLYALLTRSLRLGNSAWLKVTPDGRASADIGALMAHPLVASTSPACQRLLRALLKTDPEHRPTAHDALVLCDAVIDPHSISLTAHS